MMQNFIFKMLFTLVLLIKMKKGPKKLTDQFKDTTIFQREEYDDFLTLRSCDNFCTQIIS